MKQAGHILSIIAFLATVFSLKSFGQEPEIPVISSLNVLENNHVKVNWYPINNVAGFIIAREPGLDPNDIGHNHIDTIYQVETELSEYIDNLADASMRSYSYLIFSFTNNMDTRSLPSNSHATIFLNPLYYDTCSNQVILNWTPYMGWSQGVASYEVFKNDDVELGFDKSDTTFFDTQVSADQYVEYYVIATRKNGSSFTSHSNRVSMRIPTLKIPDPPLITEITNNGSNFTATVLVDTDADLWGYKFMAANELDANYSVVDSMPLSDETTLQFEQPSGVNSLFYKVVASNICGENVVESEVIRPIKLNYEQVDLDVTLKWNKSFVNNSTETYDLFLSIDNSDFFLQESALSATSLNYTLDGSSFGDANSELFCFYVVANSAMGQQSTSDTICITRQPKVEMPNAFTPNGDGQNDYIKPEIINATVLEYLFIVYDRYGGKVFETDDQDVKWFGSVGNKNVGEGAYLYYLEFKTSQGVAHKQSGVINVVYP